MSSCAPQLSANSTLLPNPATSPLSVFARQNFSKNKGVLTCSSPKSGSMGRRSISQKSHTTTTTVATHSSNNCNSTTSSNNNTTNPLHISNNGILVTGGSDMAKRTILVTGGTGYIGSHTALELLVARYNVIILDNLYNSSEEVLNRIELICGLRPLFYNVDVTNKQALEAVFEKHRDISSVIHFAALKSVGESSEIPEEYHRVNVGGTATLLSVMKKYGVFKIVFSSSATVYGDVTKYPGMLPIPETCPLGPTNPYGNTKWFNELIIQDFTRANEGSKAALLRYFNPCGAHPSGIMGEDPQGVPYNLLPLLGQVAVGKRENIKVFGTDYKSHDGTPIRDYIHVVDIAQGHIAALKKLYDPEFSGCREWNLGSGHGSTVFDILKAFNKAVGRELPYEVAPRRVGDVLDLTAQPDRAMKELGWSTKKTLEDACTDLWRWVKYNPSGYRDSHNRSLLQAWRVAAAKEDGAGAESDD